MRHRVFCRHFGRRSVTADLNQVAFFARGSVNRVSHPADCGDYGSVFRVSEHVLSDIVQIGARANGTPTRWRYTEITPSSFIWHGEVLKTDGKTWRLEAEFHARRTDSDYEKPRS